VSHADLPHVASMNNETHLLAAKGAYTMSRDPFASSCSILQGTFKNLQNKHEYTNMKKDQWPTPAAPESHCLQISSCRLSSMVFKTALHKLSWACMPLVHAADGAVLGDSQCALDWAGLHAADGADAGAIRTRPWGPLGGTFPAQVFCFNICQSGLWMFFSGPGIATCHGWPAMQQVDCCNLALAKATRSRQTPGP
jgi:hypothetical protein